MKNNRRGTREKNLFKDIEVVFTDDVSIHGLKKLT